MIWGYHHLRKHPHSHIVIYTPFFICFSKHFCLRCCCSTGRQVSKYFFLKDLIVTYITNIFRKTYKLYRDIQKTMSLDKSTQNWLVVSTHLKNISQIGSFPQVGMKIKNIWNHHLGNHGTTKGKIGTRCHCRGHFVGPLPTWTRLSPLSASATRTETPWDDSELGGFQSSGHSA